MALFPLVGAGISLQAFTSKIAIGETWIERDSALGHRRMAFAEIRGRREYTVSDTEGGSTRYLRLESNDGSAPLDFGKKLYRLDETFWRWFYSLPDLDAEHHKDSNFGLI